MNDPSAAIGLILGGLITIGVAVFIEYLRTPRLSLRLVERPLDLSPAGPVKIGWRAVRLTLINKALRGPRWLTRSAALQCRATISFHHLDGRNVFGRAMEGRWANSPEPNCDQRIWRGIAQNFRSGGGQRPNSPKHNRHYAAQP